MRDVMDIVGFLDGDCSNMDSSDSTDAILPKKKRKMEEDVLDDLVGGNTDAGEDKATIDVVFVKKGRVSYSEEEAKKFDLGTICRCSGETIKKVDHIFVCACNVPKPHQAVMILKTLPRMTVFLDIDIKQAAFMKENIWYTSILSPLIEHIKKKFKCLQEKYCIYVRNGGRRGGLHIQFPDLYCHYENYNSIIQFFRALLYFEGVELPIITSGNLQFNGIKTIMLDEQILNYNICGGSCIKEGDVPKSESVYRLCYSSETNIQATSKELETYGQALEPSLYPCGNVKWPFDEEAGIAKLQEEDPTMYLAAKALIYSDSKLIPPKRRYNYDAITHHFLIISVQQFIKHSALQHVYTFGSHGYIISRLHHAQMELSHTINLFYLADLEERKFVRCFQDYEKYQDALYTALSWKEDSNSFNGKSIDYKTRLFNALRASIIHKRTFFKHKNMVRFIMPVLVAQGKNTETIGTLSLTMRFNSYVMEQCRNFLVNFNLEKKIMNAVQLCSQWFIHATLIYMIDKTTYRMWFLDEGWCEVSTCEVNSLFNTFFNSMLAVDIGGFSLQMVAQGDLYPLGKSSPMTKRYYLFDSTRHSLLDVQEQITFTSPCAIATHALKPLPHYINENLLHIGQLLTLEDIQALGEGCLYTEIPSYTKIKDLELKVDIAMRIDDELLNLQHAVRLLMVTACGNFRRFQGHLGYVLGMLAYQVGKSILTIFGPGQNGKTFVMWMARAAVQGMIATVAAEDLKAASTLSHTFADTDGVAAFVADDIKEGGDSGTKMMTNMKKLTSQAPQKFRQLYRNTQEKICDVALIILANYTFSLRDKDDAAVRGRLVEVFCPGSFSNPHLSDAPLDPLKDEDYTNIIGILRKDEMHALNLKPYQLWKQDDLTYNIGAGYFILLGYAIFHPKEMQHWRNLARDQYDADRLKYGHLPNFNLYTEESQNGDTSVKQRPRDSFTWRYETEPRKLEKRFLPVSTFDVLAGMNV